MDVKRERAPSRRTRALGLLAALLAVAIVLTLRAAGGGDTPDTAIRWLPDASPLLAPADGAATGDDRLREGLAAYTNRDPATAIEALGRANASGPFESVRRVYLGSALAHAGRAQEATAILERTPLDSLPEPWRSDGTWTLASLRRDAGNGAAADSLLRRLAEGDGPAAGRARDALRRN